MRNLKRFVIIELIVCLIGFFVYFLVNFCFHESELFLFHDKESKIDGMRIIEQKKVEVIDKKLGEDEKYRLIVNDGEKEIEISNFPDNYEETMILYYVKPSFGKTLLLSFIFLIFCIGMVSICSYIAYLIEKSDPAYDLE